MRFSFQEDRSRLWTARHKLYYAALALRPGSRMVTTDVAVPVTELPRMLIETSEDIENAGLTGSKNLHLIQILYCFLTS